MRGRLDKRRWRVIAGVALGLGLTVVPSRTFSAESADEAALKVAKGRVTYRVYCSNCHGEEGYGDGSLAELLKVPPADLTVLRRNNRGKFPTERVLRVIDGREEVKGHGGREMPIWGEAFGKTLQPTWSEQTDEERIEAKIREVTAYLESIQKKD